MWGWGYNLRPLPTVNYAESSDEEVAEEDLQAGLNFHSPLTSPRRPQPTREGSPVGQVEGGPTLADNVDDELEEVQYKLHDIAVVREEIEEVTDLLNEVDTRIGEDDLTVSEVGTEIVDSGLVSEVPLTEEVEAGQEPAIMPPAVVVDFEDENGEDGDNALREGNRAVDKLVWDNNNLPFLFAQLENRLAAADVKKQFTKFQVLSNILPKEVQDEVMHLLIKKATEFPENDAYKQLKTEVLRIFGPGPDEAVNRALNRVLIGKPSQLARALVNDLCKKKLDGCECCPHIVRTLWKKQLGAAVNAGIAHTSFNKETFNQVTQLADDIHSSQTASAAVNAMTVAAVSHDETLPAIPYPVVQEVAAISRGGGRGRGRGGRGRGRGGRGQGGQGSQPQASAGATPQPRHKGAKHPDLPPGEWRGCSMHFRWGRGAHFCSEPGTCPWKNVFAPKPKNK